MSTTTDHAAESPEAHGDAADHGDHESGHLSDKKYILIALLLAGLTAIEVSTYYVDFGWLFLPTLFILMIVKFWTVVSFFMHLRFDNRIFTVMFYTGLFLAVFVYVLALFTVHTFTGN